ncbi:MAG: hypothetical protein DESF_01493 [Desulfovibrio sp.]
MSKLMQTVRLLDSATCEADYNQALEAAVYDALFLQSMVADFLGIVKDNEADIHLSNDGARGLALILNHCNALLSNCCGILPQNTNGAKSV